MSVKKIVLILAMVVLCQLIFAHTSKAATIKIETIINDFDVIIDGQPKKIDDDHKDQITIPGVSKGKHVLVFKDASIEPLFNDYITNIMLEEGETVTVFFFPELRGEKEKKGTIVIRTKIPGVTLSVDSSMRQVLGDPGETKLPIYKEGFVRITLQDSQEQYQKLEKEYHITKGSSYNLTYAPDKINPRSSNGGEKKVVPVKPRDQIILYQIEKFE